MFHALSVRLVVFGLLTAAFPSANSMAAERAAELLPATTVFYAEISQPADTIGEILEHPLADQVREHEMYQEAIKSPAYRQFRWALRFAEAELGMKWLEAVQQTSAGGVTLALDAKTEGVAVIVEAESAESLHHIVEKIMGLARQDAKDKGEDDPYKVDEYRGQTIYAAENAAFALSENRLVLVNKPDLGRQLIDGLLDGVDNSLAEQSVFQAADQSSHDTIAWGYANLEMLRDAGVANELFARKVENPAVELLVGGVMEILPKASYVTARLTGLPEKLQLTLETPFDAAWVSENREHYFGPDATGQVTTLRTANESMLSLSVYRNLAEIWLRAGDLFGADVNDGIAQADATLTTLFAGQDFGEDILGSLAPEMQFVVGRQTFADDQPTPDIKLPGFALVTRMKDPQTTQPEFRRLFLSLIGFLNIVAGAEEGRPQLDMDMRALDKGQLIATKFVPLAKSTPAEQTNIAYNFTPTAAFAGDLFILSSTAALAEDLVGVAPEPIEIADAAPREMSRVNLAIDVPAAGVRQALEDNREYLIAQNMLENGHSRKEAMMEIGVLFDVLALLKSAELHVLTTEQRLRAVLAISFAESAE